MTTETTTSSALRHDGVYRTPAGDLIRVCEEIDGQGYSAQVLPSAVDDEPEFSIAPDGTVTDDVGTVQPWTAADLAEAMDPQSVPTLAYFDTSYARPGRNRLHVVWERRCGVCRDLKVAGTRETGPAEDQTTPCACCHRGPEQAAQRPTCHHDWLWELARDHA